MHLCLFDIDGTLISTGGAGQAAFVDTFYEDFGIENWSGDVAFSGRSDRAIVADLFRHFEFEDSPQQWDKFRSGYLRRLPQMLSTREGKILPGMEQILNALAIREDVAVGLLTGNILEGAKCKLGHYNLFDHFAFGGYGDLHHDRAEIAIAALEAAQLHLKPTKPFDSVVVIGDTPHDVRCARAINATAVAVCTGFCEPEELRASKPDLFAMDFEDPTPFLNLFR